ncbi:MAG: hypothetical protein WED07_00860 [Candidatus Freyarchaeum deiterrae]
MKEKIEDLMNRVKSSMYFKAYLALMDEDGKILYNNFNDSFNRTLRGLVPILKTLDTGEYHVRRLARSRLIILRVSDGLVLAAESYARDGILIFTMNNAVERLREEFVELDLLMTLSDMALPESESKIVEQLV